MSNTKEKEKTPKKPVNKEINKANDVLYYGVRRLQDLDTGEIIEAPEMIKTSIPRNGFLITYLSAITNLIEVLGGKKLQVVKYILNNMEYSNNSLIITGRELSAKCNVSYAVVVDTLKILESANIITKRTGAIMVNSDLVHRGDAGKEKILITRFQEFNEFGASSSRQTTIFESAPPRKNA
jgi:DNA-binding MarR family transcriptional regulator